MTSRRPRPLCLLHPEVGMATHREDVEAYHRQVRGLYEDTESLALNQLVELKAKLRNSAQDEFIANVCQGFTEISQSQYCFVMNKIFTNSERRGAEICAFNEPESHTTATYFYYDNGLGVHGKGRNVSSSAYKCPCSFMKRGQAVLIPANTSRPDPTDPNAHTLKLTCEEFLSIPLFVRENCVGYLCAIWTPEGAAKRTLSWGFLEMLLHSLEDQVIQQLINSANLGPSAIATESKWIATESVPLDTSPAELERFAKKISHELRTPLQGIMGLSDLMHATLHDASAMARSSTAKTTFQNLKYDVEAVQSSSRRAVDAADNVVQAYELNMLVPGAQNGAVTDEPGNSSQNIPRGVKRKLSEPSYFDRPIRKIKIAEEFGHFKIPPTVLSAPCESLPIQSDETSNTDNFGYNRRKSNLYTPPFIQATTPGVQLTNVRDCIRDLVLETVKRDDRLILIRTSETERGQALEVHTTASNREIRLKNVLWDVDSSVPEFILVEQRDMAKCISCVLHNALKFTDKGRIGLYIKHCRRRGSIVITVKDTGPGISPGFRDEIFKPFAQEDDSITRCKEGLGLGLSVAKGLAQRMGGELNLVSAESSGPNRGCEFALLIPISESARPSPASVRSRNVSAMHKPQGSLESLDDESSSISFAELPETPIMSADCTLATSCTENTSPIFSPPLPSGLDQTSRPVSPFSDPEDECHLDQRTNTKRSLSYSDSRPALSQTTFDEFTRPGPNQGGTRASNASAKEPFEHSFAAKHPLNFLVAEDNAVNRKLLVKMLARLGYDARTQIREACDGVDAVRQVKASAPDLLPWRRCSSAPPLCASTYDEAAVNDSDDTQFPASTAPPIDVILMDLWMPNMDGYEATEKILQICKGKMDNHAANGRHTPVILAVTADATQASLERAAQVGMSGLMLKPFGMDDLERIVRDGWARRKRAEANLWNGPRLPNDAVDDPKLCNSTEISAA